MPPQIRNTGQAFGRTLFKGLGDVLANAPNVIQAQKQQMQAQAIERFKVGLLAIQSQRQQQESQLRILNLQKTGRGLDLEFQQSNALFMTREQRAELDRKQAGLKANQNIQILSNASKQLSGLGNFSLSGVGGITQGQTAGLSATSINFQAIKTQVEDEFKASGEPFTEQDVIKEAQIRFHDESKNKSNNQRGNVSLNAIFEKAFQLVTTQRNDLAKKRDILIEAKSKLSPSSERQIEAINSLDKQLVVVNKSLSNIDDNISSRIAAQQSILLGTDAGLINLDPFTPQELKGLPEWEFISPFAKASLIKEWQNAGTQEERDKIIAIAKGQGQ